MENARGIIGKVTQKLMDFALFLWTLLSELHQRSTKMRRTGTDDGMEMGYDALDTSSASESSFVTAYSEFELENECPIDDNTPRVIEIDNKAFVIYSDNDNVKVNKENDEKMCLDNEGQTNYKENQDKENEESRDALSELDHSFSFSYEEIEDCGYESDSESHGSNSRDSDEDSLTSDTYTTFDDVSDDEDMDILDDNCAPPPPIRITPIERTMPVSEGLRISVLKQEAWKAMPYYYRQSRV